MEIEIDVQRKLQGLLVVDEFENMQGWLGKQKPKSRDDFQQRFFMLKGNTLLYFTNETADIWHPQGVIPLLGADVVCHSLTSAVFSIKFPSRTFTLKAHSIESRDQWMRVLSGVAVLSPGVVKHLVKSVLGTSSPTPEDVAYNPVVVRYSARDSQADEVESIDINQQPQDSSDNNQQPQDSTDNQQPQPSNDNQQQHAQSADDDGQTQSDAALRVIELEGQVELLMRQLSSALDLVASLSDTVNGAQGWADSSQQTNQPQSETTQQTTTPNNTNTNNDNNESPQDQISTAVSTSVAWTPVRTIVSGSKRRYNDEKYSLDLVYVTDRVIGMGLPSQGIQAFYRNPYTHVLAFLDEKHPNSYVVLNLCSEFAFDSSKFHNRWKAFTFDDHTPPPLHVARSACEFVKDFLTQDANHVVAVHCKAGKGRTGTIITMILMHLGVVQTAEQAIELFNEKRMVSGRALSNPGQLRYVKYYELCLTRGFPTKIPTVISKIRLVTTPHFISGGCFPYVRVIVNQYQIGMEKTFDSRNIAEAAFVKDQEFVDFDIGLEFDGGDVRVEVYNQNSLFADQRMFRFFFNTAFETSPFTLPKNQLDEIHKDKRHTEFSEQFAVTVTFARL